MKRFFTEEEAEKLRQEICPKKEKMFILDADLNVYPDDYRGKLKEPYCFVSIDELRELMFPRGFFK